MTAVLLTEDWKKIDIFISLFIYLFIYFYNFFTRSGLPRLAGGGGGADAPVAPPLATGLVILFFSPVQS